VRIVAVNVRSGSSRSRAQALVERCASHTPSVVVLSEYRDNAVGVLLERLLERSGFTHRAATRGHRGNGVLIAADRPFTPVFNPFGLADDEYPNALIETRFQEENLRVLGVYLPGQDRKRPHLRCLIATAQRYNEQNVRAICIGDFNSGRNATDIELNQGGRRNADEFSTADLYAELERHWTEAWLYRHPSAREFSWYPFRNDPNVRRRNGWRIDKAFVSQPLLPSLRAADYDHGFRDEGLTDHSGLIVDLDPHAEEPADAVRDG
jgi:exodeoxyribonuclease-3